MLIYLHVQAGTCLAMNLGSYGGPVRHDSCILPLPFDRQANSKPTWSSCMTAGIGCPSEQCMEGNALS